jgi:hypothetical protein
LGFATGSQEYAPTHPTSLSLIDIFSLSLASWFELAGASRAPRRPAIPGVPEQPSSHRLDEEDEEKLLCRTAPSPPLPVPSSSSSATAPSPSRAGESLSYLESKTMMYRFVFLFFLFLCELARVLLGRPCGSLALSPVRSCTAARFLSINKCLNLEKYRS